MAINEKNLMNDEALNAVSGGADNNDTFYRDNMKDVFTTDYGADNHPAKDEVLDATPGV